MSLENRVDTLEVSLDDIRAILASAARHAETATAIAERNAIAVQDFRQDVQLTETRRAREMQLAEARMEHLDQRLHEHIASSEIIHQRLDAAIERLTTSHEAGQQRLDEFIASSETIHQRLDAAIERLTTSHEAGQQRLDEFIFQAQRLMGNQGERLSRLEATLATLVGLSQSREGRLTRTEVVVQGLVSVSQSHENRLAQTASRFALIDDRLDRVALNMEAMSEGLRTLEAGLNRLEAIQETYFQREQGEDPD